MPSSRLWRVLLALLLLAALFCVPSLVLTGSEWLPELTGAVLLFILGIEVGGNEQIIKGLHTIGIEAVILTLGSTLGSVIAAWALWKALYRKKGKTA